MNGFDENKQNEEMHKLFTLLFTAQEPVEEMKLIEIFPEHSENILDLLANFKEYLHENTPLSFKKIAGGYKLCTRVEYTAWIHEILPPKKQRLSKALLEVLSIVAYYQPITAQDIEELRGSPPDYAINTLLERDFIYVVGKKETLGRPNIYATTEHFLKVFGLNSLDNLPKLEIAPQLPVHTEEREDNLVGVGGISSLGK